jgi:predicted hydrocarbon binding protein
VLPFVAKLLFSKQLSFEPGRFTIFGHRIVIVPVDFLLLINKWCEKDPAFRRTLYKTTKEAVYRFAIDIDRKERVPKKDMAAFLTNLTEMNGYGQIEIPRLDYAKKIAIFRMHGLPSERQVGKIRRGPIDFYWAGMLAGGAAFVFADKKMECVETKCVINGSPYCEFVAGTKASLKRFENIRFF